MVKYIAGFLDVCYLAHRADITEATLNKFDSALARFHGYRYIFQTTGVRPTGFSLPRQHSLVHYRRHIEEFGAPNGLVILPLSRSHGVDPIVMKLSARCF